MDFRGGGLRRQNLDQQCEQPGDFDEARVLRNHISEKDGRFRRLLRILHDPGQSHATKDHVIMKIKLAHPLVSRQGHALLLVLLFLLISAIILAGALDWSRSNVFLNERNNQYFRSLAAAEAATEKVLTQIKMDYDAEGENMVFANLPLYRTIIPLGTENKDWNSYTFMDLQNTASRTTDDNAAPTEYRDLTSQYRGLRGYATPIRIASRVREAGRIINVVGGIEQDVDLASIPIFQ